MKLTNSGCYIRATKSYKAGFLFGLLEECVGYVSQFKDVLLLPEYSSLLPKKEISSDNRMLYSPPSATFVEYRSCAGFSC